MQTEVQLKGSSEIRLVLHPAIVEYKCKASVKTETQEKPLRLVFKLQSGVGADLFDVTLSQILLDWNGKQQVAH